MQVFPVGFETLPRWADLAPARRPSARTSSAAEFYNQSERLYRSPPWLGVVFSLGSLVMYRGGRTSALLLAFLLAF
jgi:hypothetical protein